VIKGLSGAAGKGMSEHDHSYKLLFSHPQMVRDLLEGFIPGDWLSQFDYDSLQKVSGSYVSDDLRDRADDIVWRARWGDGWIYVYLLIEFQSVIEPYMAVRILTYVGLLYQDLIKSRQLPDDGRLPPVLPIVLYRGSARWSASLDVGNLLQPGPRALDTYRPQIRYVLIDQGRYDSGELASLRNLVAALFRLENGRTHAEIDGVVRRLIEWLRSPQQDSLRRAFSVWLGRVILGRLPGGAVTHVDDLQEMRAMLADQFQEWREEFERKASQDGLRRGLQEGFREGEARLLLHLLASRFGDLPQSVQERVRQADVSQLERWGERLLDARTLEDLFG
jgi:predicted transposase YdaD